MSCRIYIIEDRHNLKYVGSTTQTLNKRLIGHKTSKKSKKESNKYKCSSCELDLDNCEIKLLEICPIERRKYVEHYWINHIECVNKYNGLYDKKKCDNEWRKKNREKCLKISKKYENKNRQMLNEKHRKRREYQRSWGGDLRYINNCMLKIDTTLFQ